ncbi:hypothetical protein H0H93_001351 [Arthromyces matolae]|nr:hypothetical protein H0H93_001351 [Arthromyces matolae]
MSLSRILNDDPVPAVSSKRDYPLSTPPTVLPDTSPLHLKSPASNGHYLPHDRSEEYQPSRFSNLPASTPHHLPEHPNRRPLSPDRASDFTPYEPPANDALPRKRRRGANSEAEENRISMTRRSNLQKLRTKPTQSSSARSDSPELDHQQGRQLSSTKEEHHAVSSDLEDCPDIWREELRAYAAKTQRRHSQLADWFKACSLCTPFPDRNAGTARDVSHWYSNRIARIPSPPPPAPYDSHFVDDDFRDPYFDDEASYDAEHHSRDFNVDAADAANELERSILGDHHDHDLPYFSKLEKRERGGLVPSDSGDMEIGPQGRPAQKKRKLDNGAAAVPVPNDGKQVKGKGKSKALERDATPDSISVTPKPTKKKTATKKQVGLTDSDLKLGSNPSVSGDVTPSVSISRPPSPASAPSGVIFEMDEDIPPLKKAKKVDDLAMVKRLKALEESQRKVWTNIARRDIAKVYKYQVSGYQARQSQMERIAKVASLQARRPYTKTAKATKDVQTKAKRLMREMQVFWKKNEKEERDVRKREQKEASDRLKIEEEKREAARQARKLEFLISQTELYSHFVGNKLKSSRHFYRYSNSLLTLWSASDIEGQAEGGESRPTPTAANLELVDPNTLQDINFDDDDQTNLHRHAMHNAQEALALAKQRAETFDAQTALERKTNEALKLAKAQAHIHNESTGNDADEQQANQNEPAGSAKAPLVDLDSDELNFQNPTSLSGPLTIGQPKMLMAQLKEYQLKGLNWLATLYEQGINGILADEMGLGKTVQSISLLTYLAETHDIWGPFLVVAPASTLHNWQQEITRFVPGLKALPYWGNVKDRATLRKFWSKKDITYNKDAPFHVLVTSYQLVTQDQQYFQRIKWQYMILDEAQNIKNSASVRWKTLLGFQCRNRLLLTGTPIQNSMQDSKELWALLHFIMPSLFDSHDEFNEWFSKDIENAAENKGSKLNEHQLRRLHMILKPFMLRRVKRHVQNELSEKIEKDIYVDLSARQRSLYSALLSHVSVADLLAKAANIGDADSARSLMNLVMQFRKLSFQVCNHPELFERADVIAPFSFCEFGRPGPLMREGDFVLLPYSSRNPIEFVVPEIFCDNGGFSSCTFAASSSYSFLRFAEVTASEAHSLHNAPLIRRRLCVLDQEASVRDSEPDALIPSDARPTRFCLKPHLQAVEELPALRDIATTSWMASCLSRPELRWFVPAVVAPPITLSCTNRIFMDSEAQFLSAPLESLAFYGMPASLTESETACEIYNELFPRVSITGLLRSSPVGQLPLSTMQVPEAKRLIYDSAKLARLDLLLQELKQGDHRVLVYFQMTKMMDLMEEYLIYRQYKYLRLDGSSKIEDRRDMVIDWQTRPDIFVFLLSTRAGGLGINLTAADTVIFYDHDWNPSNDAQAMDRAHRLGQTRQVTVYRLITKGTIDERIVQLARVKKDVQDIVVGNKNFTDVTKPSEIVQLLLNDEQLATLGATSSSDVSVNQTQSGVNEDVKKPAQDLWNDEEDNFFGHSTALVSAPDGEDQGGISHVASGRGKKRKNGASGAPRGRRPGTGGRKKQTGSVAPPETL